MIGILTEKPSQKRAFAKALGGEKGIYNGEEYVIACARGHLCEFAPPSEQVAADKVARYKTWSSELLPWDEQDFQWKKVPSKDAYGKDTDSKALLKDIKATFAKCDELVYGGDWDPSGEGFMISYEVFSYLGLRPKKWSRMHFVDEAPASIQHAFTNRAPVPVPEQNEEFLMADYRGKWDFCSMQWTRLARDCGDGKSILRQGRLKSAMVLLVGDQLKLVDEYQKNKKPFYQNRFRDENGVVYTNPEEPTYPSKAEVPQTYHSSAVQVDSKTMKSSAPPKLLDLATLSARLAPQGAKAKVVLSTYQKMYEAQIVSYPRTEDKTITPEQFNELLPLADKIAAVVGVDPALLTHRSPRSTHVKAGGAHGANRPGTNVPKSLNDLTKYGPWAKEIYDLLARSYLAMLGEDYQYEAQKGHLVEYPKFVGSSNVPKVMGWKVIFGDDTDVDDEDSQRGLGIQADPFVYEGFPPKPATPTMKWLMAQLEKRDIGTGATRTSTYADVTSETTQFPLLKETKGKLSMTQYGDVSYRLLPGTNIGSLDVTKRLQDEMKDIAAGKKDPAVCLRDIRRMVTEDVAIMRSNGETMRKELGVIMATANVPVERCSGTWNGREVSFKKSWSGHDFTDDECARLLNGEEIEIDAVSAKTGKAFRCKGILAEQEYNGRKYVGFQRTGFVNSAGVKNGVPDEWCQHKFTQSEKDALEAGLSIQADDFVSKKGNKFSARVRYGQNERGFMGIIADFT
jgi:DNA topoisomerase-3